jgi:RNA polymerase sigma-70 factor (sigma-E family)
MQPPGLPEHRSHRAVNDWSTVGVGPTEGGRLGELYITHSRRAVRLAYLLTGDRELAEDLAQEAFARLAGRFVELRAPEAFESYLRRMVVNLARMHFRRRRVERRHLALHSARSGEENPQSNIDDDLAMREALLALPERQRAALVLRFYEDLSETQIAEVLRCRPGTVKSLVHRGLNGLRSRILLESRGN